MPIPHGSAGLLYRIRLNSALSIKLIYYTTVDDANEGLSSDIEEQPQLQGRSSRSPLPRFLAD